MYLILHQTIAMHDAIGNDITCMHDVLNQLDRCVVYAQNKLNKYLKYVSSVEVKELVKNKDVTVIYHHSGYWEEGEEILNLCKGKIIFRYHNITPAFFFEEKNAFMYSQCKRGSEQTIRFIEKFPEAYWLSDSYYNNSDLVKVKADRKNVCPPFHNIGKWTKTTPNEKILSSLLNGDDINLLFVGRVAPNKGHLFLLDILHTFLLNYDRRIKLRIIGKLDDNLMRYNEEIRQNIKLKHLVDKVEFIGEINDESLLAYYLGSDFYVNTSEHEGFCVPVIEAQYLSLPIISRDNTALSETAGRNQLLLEDDVRQFAAAIKIVYENDLYYNKLVENGRENFSKRFTYEKIKDNFLKCLRKVE